MASESGPAVRYPTFKYRPYPDFEPRDTLALTSRAAVLSTGAGVFVAALKASLGPSRTSLGSIITHSRYIWLYGAVGTAYTVGEAVTANLHQKESAWNTFVGGMLAGGVMGASYKNGARVSKVIGGAIALGTILGLAHWTGNFNGYDRKEAAKQSSGEPVEVEKGDRQTFWQVVHRRPLSQTIDELGDLVRPIK
uniref:ARAD1D14542p n=1 Tax=Blastobotrys adeninivorans TaxID=409370 RepID=A0A060T9D3_BLAAD